MGPAKFFQTDKNRLLIVVAPTLRSLEIGCHHHRIHLPFVMPALMDLTIYGYPGDEPLPTTITCYPALRRLNYNVGYTSPHGPSIISLLKVAAPNLSALRLSMYYNSALLALVATLPLKKVLFAFNRMDTVAEIMQALQSKAGRDDTFILLKARPTVFSSLTAVAAIRNRWTDVCAGHADHWNPAEDEIDIKIVAASGDG